MIAKVVSLALCTGLAAAASMMIATVTASGPVEIGSHRIPATALSAFPLTLGDKLSTLDGQAVIRIGANTVMRLEARSTLKLESPGDGILVRLLDGTLHYEVATDANVQVFALDQPARKPLVGTIKVDSRRRKALFFVGAGGAAAVLSTVGLVKRSSNCPPEGCAQ
jgi:hypothetical protein